ncbi:kunitz-type protease inhibitor 2 [Mixophyes fleayi]|uniref:kunitz-type protease inhibitor 2 n=1 Tax=Mixophyes fleayi TaxID=3061075 RepID=UPI003F4D77BC
MAAWLRGLLLLLLPLALADTQLPCAGFQVEENMGMADLENPSQTGVKVLESSEDVEDHCWTRCCENDQCDLAVMSEGKCHLLRCAFKDFNMCALTKQEGAKSFRKVESGVQPKQEDFCLSEAETGMCRALFIRWWYNAKTETCKNFTYGGCGGNLNNHVGEEECMNKCRGIKVVESSATEAPIKPQVAASSSSELCMGPAKTGNCRAAFPRWYFDAEAMTCHKFTYGGCGGNKNNHMSEQDCLNKCTGEHDDNSADHHTLRHPMAAVVLPVLLAILVAALFGAMILFFVKVAKKNRQDASNRAMWHPIDDKECLVNNAYTL